MTRANELSLSAQLALASYADLLSGDTGRAENLNPLTDAGLAPTQRTQLIATYPTIITQFNDTPVEDGMNTGFSVTVFRDLLGNLTVAFRGTDKLGPGAQSDLPSGADIVGSGIAYDQIVAMANWWARASATAGQMVKQFKLVSYAPDEVPVDALVLRPDGVQVLVLESAPRAVAFDNERNFSAALAADPDGRVDLAGHSLGGHLSIAFSSLFDAVTGQVTVFNTPGFIDNPVNQAFFEKLGGSIPRNAAENVINVAADEALVNESPFKWIAGMHSRPGIAIDVAIEKQLNSDEPIPFAALDHSIVALTDSLAVYKLLADLDPTLSLANYKVILNQAAMFTAASLERVVDTLVALFRVNDSVLEIGNGARAREALYTAIADVRNKSQYGTKVGMLTIEPTPDKAIDLLAGATSAGVKGLAYRYALNSLAPFLVLGDPAQSLYNEQNANGELDLYDAANRAGTLTPQWLEDRAAFLERKLYITGLNRNRSYEDPVTSDPDSFPNAPDARGQAYQAEAKHFEDRASGFVATDGSPNRNSQLHYVFGSDQADNIVGASREDHLYGGSGTDILTGGAAEDYLEGGSGLDLYTYSSFSGLLGSGNDGADIILDTDGTGVLHYTFTQSGLLSSTAQTTVIADASVRVSGLQWGSADGKFTYLRNQDDLVITINGDAGGSITLRDFRDGDFGIHLWETRATPQTASTIFGDLEPQDFDPATLGTQTQIDALGNVIVTAEAEPDRDDVLFGNRPDVSVDPTTAGERIEAGGGHDRIFSDRPRGEGDNGFGDADWIVAGAGRDIIESGPGSDLIEAGPDGMLDGQAGGDVADAGPGDDEVYAESKVGLFEALRAGNEAAPTNLKGDLLSGASGDDWIVSDRANDMLLGGSGQDLIVGGAGDDNIWGDVDLISYTHGWQVNRAINVEAGRASYTASVTGAAIADSVAGAADVIYGGAGGDWIFAGGGDDFVDAGPGNDVTFGEAGSDILIGGAGDDVLAGDNRGEVGTADEGGDYLDGGTGRDQLFGDGGDDILIGGPGNDTLNGGPGKDIYVFNKGDGVDIVIDTPSGIDHSEASILVLGEGFSKGDIKFHLGSLVVDLGPLDPSDPNSARDQIHFEGFDPDDPLSTLVLGEIRFADGESMSYGDILAQGFDLDGTEGADVIIGTSVTDRINGKGGDDQLFGFAGDDILVGGPGRDYLAGGEGLDTYIADFEDTIDDTSGGDLIDLGLASPQEVVVSRASIEGRAAIILSPAADADPARPREGLIVFGDISAQNARFAFGGEELSSEAFFNLALTDDFQFFGTTGDDVLRGFGGADHLVGFDGDDLLVGGAGNDFLEGGQGSDTLEGEAGADTLVGGPGNDIYVIRPGGGLDTIIDAGDEFLVDAIQFSAGIARETITFTREASGDLKVILNEVDQIAIVGHYTDSTGRIEEFRFADGQIITAGELDGLESAPILGSSGDDVLVGGPFDDTLVGLAGADTLEGKGGNDDLMGGEGVDTYVLDYAMGRDTVTDSGENIIELRSGLTAENLSATRRGADLSVSIRGTAEGLTLKDYYTFPQLWRVRDASALETPIEDVITATDARTQQGAAALRDDYVAGLNADFAREFSTQGYIALGNNAFARQTDLPYSANYNAGAQNRTTVFKDVNGEITSTKTESFSLNHWNYTGSGTRHRESAQLEFQTIASNGAFISGGGGTRFQTSATSFEWTGVSWTVTAEGPVNRVSRNTIQPWLGPIDPVTGEPEFFGTIEFHDTFVFQQRFARGDIVPVPPGVPLAFPPVSRLFPEVALTRIVATDITQRFVEVIAGAGDNTITGGDIVQAGAGDDIVDSFGFIDGGPGNDTLFNGRLMTGGAGDDQLIGGDGKNHFWLAAEGNGTDVIRDEGGISVSSFAALYYRSIGAPHEAVSMIEEGDADLDQVIEQFGLPQLLRPDDLSAIEPILAAIDSPSDVVEFGAGVGLTDLSFAWNVEQATLEITWAGGIAAIAFPLSNSLYGFGVERFSFADGTELSMSELLAFAPPRPVLPIRGTAEEDDIEGSRFDDVIFGLEGDDDIEAGRGDDTLEGGAGNDGLDGGAGSDLYLYGLGDGNDFIFDFDFTPGAVDTVRFGVGILPEELSVTYDGLDNFIFEFVASGDSLFIDRAATNPAAAIERFEFADGTVWDRAFVEALAGSVVGTDEANLLVGTDQADRILGFGGNDSIFAGDGDDYILGGPGDDTITGGSGFDLFVFNLGDGVDTITDAGIEDRIFFGPGITPDSLSLGLGSLVIRVGSGGDALHLGGFDPSNALGGMRLEDIIFSDSSSLSFDELVARGFDLKGTAGDDIISGTNVTDRINGFAGNDILVGGAGNDVYYFGFGHELDVIDDAGGALDRVVLLDVFSPADVAVTRAGNFILLEISATDRLAIRWQPEEGYQVERVQFADSTVWDAATLEAMAVPAQGNMAPALADPIVDQTALEDAAFSFTIPASTIVDPDAGDVLDFSASLSVGAPLPSWLSFDAATRSFTGTPTNEDVGAFEVSVIATDSGGLSASDTFTLTVDNTNDFPVLLSPISNQVGNQNAPLAFSIPAGNFDDIDLGDVLTFSATLADGQALPAWLEFDPATRMFNGTPGEDDAGLFLISIAATDSAGASVTGGFVLSISDAAAALASYQGTKRGDVIHTGFENDFIDAGKGDDSIVSGPGRDLVLAGKGDDRVYGGYGNDYLLGGQGNDYLFGEAGSDVLFGEHGDDHLDGGAGNNVLDGGKGKDRIAAGAGNNLIIGGPGSDILYGGSAHDVFLFNRGDGKATLILEGAATGGNTDTISLGKGIAPDNIVLRRKNKDLIVSVVESDNDDDDDDDDAVKIVLGDWYESGSDNRTVTRLQLIDDSVEIYDFAELAARFDAATGGRNRQWRAGAAMGGALLSISNTDAIGGALAYQYAMQGTLAGVSTAAIQETLADPLFGESAQMVVDHDGATLAAFLTGGDGEDGGVEGFFALFSDSGFIDGPLPVTPGGTEEVRSLPLSVRKDQKNGDDSDGDERLESLIKRWFGGDHNGSRSLRKFLDEDHDWGSEQRKTGRGAHHMSQDEVAACWRRTQRLLEAHLANQDPAALAGGEDHGFSPGLGGGGYSQFVLSGDRLPRVSGHHLRRLEGLEEGLSKLYT